MANEYSKSWFEIFMDGKSRNETEREVNFLVRNLPINRYPRVLDVCCGYGRHANELAQKGYDIIGIERDACAIAHAKAHASKKAKYILCDMRDISSLQHSFDAIINMWQSFGYFDENENSNIIRQISDSLVEGGRFILDIYNKTFFINNLGRREFQKKDLLVTEDVKLIGNRFNTKLSYNNNVTDEFNWYLYSKDEIISLCNTYGLVCKTACTWCDEGQVITDSTPRMQFIFEKNSNHKE